MSFLAPYTNAMRIGQGFNSYTQEICIENAVIVEPARTARASTSKRSSTASIDSKLLHPSAPSKSASPNVTIIQPKASIESLASNATASSVGSHINEKTGSTEALIDPGTAPTTAKVIGASTPAEKASTPTANGATTVKNGITPLEIPATSVHQAEATPPHKNVVQIVTYSSRMVDNVSDIVEALNISSSASIKYGTIKGAGSASIVNENKVNQSDLNYIVTVKVTNETSPIADKMTFNPIPQLENSKFTEVFGDCFISGFTEGGEFSAIVSIKVSDKSKVSAVKAAAEAEIAIAAAPGLSVGAKSSLDKSKSDVWDDTETTISVNWAGGGELKPAEDKWDLATVVDVATRFPSLVQTCAQRTSAILTRYTSLRSFNEVDARNSPEDRFKILDYDLCTLYTQDLFSSFVAYKNIWAELSEMLRNPEEYQERDEGKNLPNPVLLTPQSLNETRRLASKGLTQITDLTKALITNPALADLDENGQQRPVTYMWPGELKRRMPIKHHGLTIREQANLARSTTNFGLLNSQEMAKVGTWARNEDVQFSPLIGDLPRSQHSWLDRNKDTVFCSLDFVKSSYHPGNLTKLRFHAHQDRSINWLSIFGGRNRSKRCHGQLSAIGFSTTDDTRNSPGEDGTHHVLGKANKNQAFWSQPLADLTRSKASKVRIEYAPGSQCVAALAVLDSTGQELTSWKEYGQAKVNIPAGLKSVEQEAPDARSGWVLAGFWGHADSFVITSVGAIWRKAG